MRAKEFLKAVSVVASQRQFGFMPHNDASEMWLMIQALVECSVQGSTDMVGFVTDLQKAFEHIPRLPIYELVVHMGMDHKIADLWLDAENVPSQRGSWTTSWIQSRTTRRRRVELLGYVDH